MSIERIKQLLTDGKSESAADMLLNYVNDTHSKHYQAALLIKNRIENIQLEEIEGTISQADKNTEWAKISKSVLSLALLIEKEEQHQIESRPTGKSFAPTVSFDFPFTKVFVPIILVSIPVLLYFYFPRPKAPQTVNLEIQAFDKDKNAVFTEGGKLQVRWDEKNQREVILSKSGKGFLQSVPMSLLDKPVEFQSLDTQYYSLVQTDLSQVKKYNQVKLFFEVKKVQYAGRIVNPDDEPVGNVIIIFGNSIANDTSDAQGNYSVLLPINAGEHIVVHLSKNKNLFEQRIRIDKSVLKDLTVPRNFQ
jgi:hypothetical protein